MRRWQEAPIELEQDRRSHAVAVLPNNDNDNEKVYEVLISGGLNLDGYLDSIDAFHINTSDNTIHPATASIPDLPVIRSGHASVIIHDYLYIIGGRFRYFEWTNVFRINVHNPEEGWEDVANMAQERSQCTVAVHGGKIYAFGEKDVKSGCALSTVEVLDTANLDGGWSTVPNEMVTGRYDHSVVTVGDIIYVIGGKKSKRNRLDSVEKFDPLSQTFSRGPSLPITVEDAVAVAVGKLIVVVGGYTTNGQNLQESFVLDTTAVDPQWERVDVAMQIPRSHHAAIFVGNHLWVFGGFLSGRYLDSIETISIVDLIPHDLLHMTALHVLCCDPNITVDKVKNIVNVNPSALGQRDITGKIPMQRFLITRGLEGKSKRAGEGEAEGEEDLPSLCDLLEKGIKGDDDWDILFLLKNDLQEELLVCDESTHLVPFMSAATMPKCGLDAVYSLAMRKLELLQLFSDSNKRRKID